MHYRCAMVLGTAVPLSGDDQLRALEQITEHLLPGRWADARRPSRKELAATLVLALPLDEWSVKVSDGPPDDAPDDLDLPVWAGVLPLREVAAVSRCPRRTCATRTRCRRTSTGGRAGDRLPATVAVARHGRRRLGAAARRCRATSTSTSPSSAPATPGCGRRTTSRWPTRRCASRCWSARSPGSARAAATAAGARRCSRRRWSWLARRYGAERAVGAAPRDAARRRRGRPGGRRGGHRLRVRQGRHASPRPARRPSWSGPGPRSPRRGAGASARTTCVLLGAAEAGDRLAARGRARRDVHAALRGDPPRPAGARARAGRGTPGRHRPRADRRGPRSSPASSRPTAGGSGRTSWSGRPRATRHSSRGCVARSRRCTR